MASRVFCAFMPTGCLYAPAMSRMSQRRVAFSVHQRVLMVTNPLGKNVSCVQGLRVHDNPALHAACRAGATLLPVFVLDPWFLKPERVGINRLQFLLEALRDLDTRCCFARCTPVRGCITNA